MLQRHVIRTRISTILLGCILPTVVLPQARLLRVISPDSQPVVYANVTIEGGETRITDQRGTVSFGVGRRRTLSVRVARIGFTPWVGKIDLADTATVPTITLARIAQTLASVTVTGQASTDSPLAHTGFYDRWMMRQKGALSAVFIGPEEIEFRHPNKISNMLSGLHGVCLGHLINKDPGGDRISANLYAYSTQSASTSKGGLGGACPNCPMAIVVDGVQQVPVPAIDDFLDPNDVAAIEVYDRGGNMPISLQVNDNICGVIAFWTGSRK
jgi:hypothetical protein